MYSAAESATTKDAKELTLQSSESQSNDSSNPRGAAASVVSRQTLKSNDLHMYIVVRSYVSIHQFDTYVV